MATTCSACGAQLPLDAKFCPSCGSSIEAAPAFQERRLVTVLFADVMGSTGLAELMDAERLQQVMSSFFEAMREEIEAEGGFVEKFIGDAVMAVFGLPTAHEDDPSRALRAVLRMWDRLSVLNESLTGTHGVTLEMRIGVNTGEVLATTSPQPDVGTLAGDAINVAARLEEAAQPGQVLVSERTVRGSRGFAMREVELLRLRGRAEPVRAFELEGTDLVPERGIPGIQAPMVGRSREIELLSALYERVAADRTPHLVTIYGAAGVGKSRLVAEFLASVQGRSSVLRGRCLPYGQEVTYWPLAEILKAEAGALDSDPPDVALEKVRKAGRELLTPDLTADPERSTAALAYTIGLQDPAIPFDQLPPRQVRTEIQSAWRSFFSALSIERTVVAVIEDIHWADPALLELLEELADRVDGSVIFLCPARPELTERRPGWGGGTRNFSSLLLEPLSHDESEELLQLLLEIEELPAEVRSEVLEKAEGNPFFLEEVIRQLIDEGMIRRVGNRWRAQATIGELRIPDTVQAVLAARIDRLAPVEKRALQCAAVIGRVFWTGPIQVLLEADEDVDDILDRLEARQLVLSRLGSAIAGQREYAFKHILTRDVAYESLPRRDKARLHEQTARWIERTAGERHREFVELLAGHLFEAHRGMLHDPFDWDPGSVEAMRGGALRYSLQAAEDARSKMALDKATGLAERALSLAASPQERAAALEALGWAGQLDYRGDLGWRYLREAVDELLAGAPEERQDIVRLAAAAVEVPTRWPGSMRSLPSEEEVARYVEIGLSQVAPGDSEERLRLLMAKSQWPWAFGFDDSSELDRAEQAGEEAVAMARRLGRADLESAALDAGGSAYMVGGRFGKLLPFIERRLELVDQLQDALEIGDAFAMAGFVNYHVGRYPSVLRFADEGFRRTARDMPGVGIHCLAWRALASYPMGDWQTLLKDLAQLEDLLGDRRESPPYFATRPFAAAALVHEVQGDAAAADRRLAMFESLREEGGLRRSAWPAWIAMLLAHRGRFEEARALLGGTPGHNRGLYLEAQCTILAEQQAWEEVPGLVSEARHHAAEAGLLALPFHAERLEGREALAGGETDRAIRLLRQAGNGFSDLEAHWEAACAHLWLAEGLLSRGEQGRARECLFKAGRVFENLSAVRELAQSRDLLNRVHERGR
jgi:class 3 adenylate cyclase/tetratricopeptide (TPR) repeat protein